MLPVAISKQEVDACVCQGTCLTETGPTNLCSGAETAAAYRTVWLRPQHATGCPGFLPQFVLQVLSPQLQRQLPALVWLHTHGREVLQPQAFPHTEALTAAQTCRSWLFAGKGRDVHEEAAFISQGRVIGQDKVSEDWFGKELPPRSWQ